MPLPNSGESEKDFMKRCMSHPHTQKYAQKQRVAVCESLFKKKSKASIEKWGEDLLKKNKRKK